MAYKALDIAKYIVNKCTNDNKAVSNLALQKILYYIQREFLRNGSQAFEDDFEAWRFGPVVAEVYNYFCGFGAMPIRWNFDSVNVDSTYKAIMNPIIEEKRLLNPWNLVADTHQEGRAWSQVYKNGSGIYRVIPKELIKERG